MVFNAAGLLAVAEVVFRPHLLVPKLVIEDIRALKLEKLKARGVVGVVLDKDNCLTKPYQDALAPELREAWPALIKTFGRENVLIVSNSAGTRDDAGFLQAESVSRHLDVPVLLHSTKKPGCGPTVQEYFERRHATSDSDRKGKGRQTLDQVAFDIAAASTFSSETPSAPSISAIDAASSSQSTEQPKIMVIGDRVMTDVILANRMNKKRWRKTAENAFQAVPVLTTRLWASEGLGTRFMRTMETFAMRRASAYYSKRQQDPKIQWEDCVVIPSKSPAPIVAKRAVQTVRRPVYQYFSKEHFRYLLSRSARGTLALLYRLVAPMMRRLEPIMTEARQAQFGFRIPEGYKKTRLLRDVLDGRQPLLSKKQ